VQPTLTIAARLDRLPLTRLHVAVVVLCTVGFGFDFLEVAMSNILSAVFAKAADPLAARWLPLLLGAPYAGAVVGAPLFGRAADRFGRRPILATLMLILALTSAASAISPTIVWLTLVRALGGLALGAFPPVVIAYMTDVLPPPSRGRVFVLATALAGLGPLGVVFLVRWLTPLQPLGIAAYRWAFLLGAVGTLACGVLSLLLPESPRWLESTGRTAAAARACRRFEAGVDAEWRPMNAPPLPSPAARDIDVPASFGRLVLVFALYALSPWSTVAFPLLTGVVLISRGVALGNTLLYIGAATLGPIIGPLLGAPLVDRVERRTGLVLCSLAMAAAGMGFALARTPGSLIATLIAFNLLISLYLPLLFLYASELVPTPTRAAVTASAWALNRVCAAVAPLLLLPLLRLGGAVAMAGVVGGTLLASAGLVLACGVRGRAGRPVA
jgi:putative MFS transporter